MNIPPLLQSRISNILHEHSRDDSIPKCRVYYNESVVPILQHGMPQCGLVALMMAHRMVMWRHNQNYLQIPLEDYLTLAKSRKFTNNGEMFSGLVSFFLFVRKLCK
jgi:hypothetical protein